MKSRHMYPNPKLNFALVNSEKKGIFLPLFPHEKKRSKISNAASRRLFSPTSCNNNNNNNNILKYFYISAWHYLSNYTGKVDDNLLTGYSIFLDILQKLWIRVAVLFFIIAPFNRTLFHFAGQWRAHCGCGCRARAFLCNIFCELFAGGYIISSALSSFVVTRELTQRRRQRQRKRHLKINIWEMLTIFRLFLLPRILYCW